MSIDGARERALRVAAEVRPAALVVDEVVALSSSSAR
jgi:hypothetical protein